MQKMGEPADFAVKTEKKGLRGFWIKTAVMLVLVVLSVVMLFTIGKYVSGEETPQRSLSELLRTINYRRFAILLGAIVLYILVESGKYAYMLKVYTGKFRFRIAVKTMFLGKYYDGITPLSTGGQPFQIYYLHKKGIPGGTADVIPIIRYLVSIMFLSILSVILLALTPIYVPGTAVTKTVLILSWISLAINLFMPVAIVLFSLFPQPSKRFILLVVKALHKLHIVKKPFRAEIKCVREMTEYSAALKQFWREFYKFIPLFFLCIVECLLFVTLPFFVVIAIADIPLNAETGMQLIMQIACLAIISRYTALLIPTPGNTGALEFASSIVFITVAGIGSVIGWVVLVWRFSTYYMYILSGIGINIFEIIRGAVRARKKE